MLQKSIKVSLIAGSVEQLIYVFLNRCSVSCKFCQEYCANSVKNIIVKNIIVVTYCSKSHRLSLSLITVNETPLITQS